MTTGASGGILTAEEPAMAPGWGSDLAETHGAGARPGTRWPVSYGHPKCRERATCVHGLGRCEQLDDRRCSSSVLGYEANSRGIRGSQAGRKWEVKKSFCCVTTHRRNLGLLAELRREPHPLAVRALTLGMPGFCRRVLAILGLTPRRLPAPDLP